MKAVKWYFTKRKINHLSFRHPVGCVISETNIAQVSKGFHKLLLFNKNILPKCWYCADPSLASIFIIKKKMYMKGVKSMICICVLLLLNGCIKEKILPACQPITQPKFILKTPVPLEKHMMLFGMVQRWPQLLRVKKVQRLPSRLWFHTPLLFKLPILQPWLVQQVTHLWFNALR